MNLDCGHVQIGNRTKPPESKIAAITSQVPSAATGGGRDSSVSSRISVTITDRTCIRAVWGGPPHGLTLAMSRPQLPQGPCLDGVYCRHLASVKTFAQHGLGCGRFTALCTASAAAASRAAWATSGGAWILAAASSPCPAGT